MTVPRDKQPPVSDWEHQERKLDREETLAFITYDLGPIILGALLITALSVFVFWQNWNWWLIPIGILAIGAILCVIKLTDDDAFGIIGVILNVLCLVMMAFYGLYQINWDGHEVYHKTALFCGLDTEKDENGNVYQIFRGPNGDFNIVSGTYTVTDRATGKLHKEFIATGKAAAKTFVPDHAYALTIDNFEGYSLDGIIAAREVPTDETCSNR